MAATRSLAAQLDARIGRTVRWKVQSRGGFLPGEVANGVAAALADAGFAVGTDPKGRPQQRTLVVAMGTVSVPRGVHEVASFGREADRDHRFAKRLAGYVIDHAPLELANGFDRQASVDYLDGRGAKVCPGRLSFDRVDLEHAADGGWAGLYGHNQVASPSLPSRFTSELNAWMAAQPFTVYELNRVPLSGVPVFSTTSCDR
jgi:hypothetical protein